MLIFDIFEHWLLYYMVDRAELNFMQYFNIMSFRLGIEVLKLSNLKATVAHQKWCVLETIISSHCLFIRALQLHVW